MGFEEDLKEAVEDIKKKVDELKKKIDPIADQFEGFMAKYGLKIVVGGLVATGGLVVAYIINQLWGLI